LRGLAAALLLAALPSTVRADDPRFEVSLFGGASLLKLSRSENESTLCREVGICEPFEIETDLSTGLVAGLAARYRVKPHVLAVFSLSGMRSHDYFVRVEAELFPVPVEIDQRLASYHFDLSAEYEIGCGKTRAIGSLGVGRVLYDARRYRSIEPDARWALLGGVGGSHRLSDRWQLRAEIVDHLVLDHFATGDAEHDLHLRVGAAFGF
jgi:hypothetical protein